MRILFVTPFIPYPPISGGSLQVFLRIKALRERGHEIFLATIMRPGQEDQAIALAPFVDGLLCVTIGPGLKKIRHLLQRSLLYEIFTDAPGFSSELHEFGEANRVDVVLFEGLGMARYHGALAGIPAVLSEHNVECDLVRQMVKAVRKAPKEALLEGPFDERLRNLYLFLFGSHEVRLVRSLEAWAARCFDLVLTCSEKSLDLLRGIAGEVPYQFIPWSIEQPEEFGRPAVRDPYTVLFVGNMGWEPNRDAVRWFANDIFPAVRSGFPSTRFVIVGSNMTDDISGMDNGRDIIVKGFVKELESVYREADVFVAPIRRGSGANVKIIEAMAHGVPVVTTGMAAAGIGILDNEYLCIADSTVEFSRTIEGLLSDLSVRQGLADRARRYVAEHHGTGRIAALLESALFKCLDNARGRIGVC